MTYSIQKIHGREIIDSRGNPTVEADVTLDSGVTASAAVPSGASTGQFEALELRDNDKNRYGGKGVQKAVGHINNEIQIAALHGMDASQTVALDQAMIAADGTKDKSNLGANAILAVSLAAAQRRSANAKGEPLYRFLGGAEAQNPARAHDERTKRRCTRRQQHRRAGVHDHAGRRAQRFPKGLRWSAEVFHTLAKMLKQDGH